MKVSSALKKGDKIGVQMSPVGTRKKNLMIQMGIIDVTRMKTSVNLAQEWLGQLFLVPGLVWKRVSPIWMRSLFGSEQPFSCVLGLFGMVTTDHRVILD